MQVDIYGTLGPKCSDEETLTEMFKCGMSGIRLNLSHTTLEMAADRINVYHAAARRAGIEAKLLIDMQGPEIRIGSLKEELSLEEGEKVKLVSEVLLKKQSALKTEVGKETEKGKETGKETEKGKEAVKGKEVEKEIEKETEKEADDSEKIIPVPEYIFEYIEKGQEILIDDGKILLEALDKGEKTADKIEQISCIAKRGGKLASRKSLTLIGKEVKSPTLTKQDKENLKKAVNYGVTGIMQPFVRNREDLKNLRNAMKECGCENLRIFAKIENLKGVESLEDFMDLADEVVIARGDLGNAMPLWELPAVQKRISAECRNRNVPFMVVTQMLASMEKSAVPTRAEVSDIYNAVLDGASSVMVTGETAVGDYPVEVIRYLSNTVKEAEKNKK